MSHRFRRSVPDRHAVAALLVSTALLLAPAGPALAAACTHTSGTAAELVAALESPPDGAVICLLEGASHIFSEVYSDTFHALPPITSTVTLRGQGKGSTIQRSSTATSAFGLLTVTGSGHLTLSGVTLRNGLAHHTSPGGGAILVKSGSLTIDTSTVAENSASCSSENISGSETKSGETFSGSSSCSQGGAIYFNDQGGGTLKIDTSTFSNNSATNGGAIFVNAGSLKVDTSTFSGNSGATQGGAIYFQGGDSFTIDMSTLSGNSSPGGAAVFLGNSSGVTFTSSILAGPKNNKLCDSSSGGFKSDGHNLATDNSCNLSGTGDKKVSGKKLLLADLKYNGGPTQTIGFLEGSVALEAGNCTAGSLDQRGVQRPTEHPCDAGAYQAICNVDSFTGDNNDTLSIGIYLDFDHPNPNGSIPVMNSKACQLDTIKDVIKIQWNLVPFNEEVPDNYKDFAITDVNFHRAPGRSTVSTGEGVEEEAELNLCVLLTGHAISPPEANPPSTGWPLYHVPVDLTRNGSGYNYLPPDQGEDCYNTPNAKNKSLWWYYSLVWTGAVDQGNWDPRMQLEQPEKPKEER